ncbi:MAG TPA: hypothetical protein VE223_03285 [Nitrososphaeraceae archaeon]|nr:hypothetical protein [Nitrososphaeraceae archaeon]
MRLRCSNIKEIPRSVKPVGNPNKYPNPENLYVLKKYTEIIEHKRIDAIVTRILYEAATEGSNNVNAFRISGSDTVIDV